MALNIDLDGFGFLSDTEASKLSPTLKQQQPPISPIESESSSGISSLDSDDLKKQLLSSPTISHDDEDQQSDGGSSSSSDSSSSSSSSGSSVTASEKEQNDSDQNEKEESEASTDGEQEEVEEEEHQQIQEEMPVVIVKPLKVLYQKRDILELGNNVVGSGPLVQYTVLPENNVNCFFQNRAQYWRLSSGERQEYSLDKCPCCDFTYPSTQPHLNHGPTANTKNTNANAVTDSLLTFLKNNEQATAAMPMNPIKRTMPFGYPMPSQQPQQYQPPSNGFYNNTNSFNANYNQQINPFMNNNAAANNNNVNSGYGTTLALLNLMNNATRNAASAFQAMSNNSNTPRYFNNNNMNNGYGLYKQF